MNLETNPPCVYQVKIDTSGRIVLPASVRQRWGVHEGDSVLVVDDADQVRIETAAESLKEAQAYFAGLVPRDVSLADQLIAERRAEAASE